MSAWMLRSRAGAAFLVTVAVLLGAPSVPAAATGANGAVKDSGPMAPAREEALSRLDDVLGMLSTGRLADAVRSGAGLTRTPVVDIPVLDAPVPRGVPRAIAGPVGRLLGAVQTAEREVAASFRSDLATIDALMTRIERLRPQVKHQPPGVRDGRGARRLERLQTEARELVDLPRLYSASLMLARAIDDALPALRAQADLWPADAGDVAGCDEVDLPNLCVGGTADNTYTEDRALLIDLGGDDLHANSAGGAYGLQAFPVSVAVDLSGDDRYEAVQPLASGTYAVQGAANYGIGALVDVEGDDVYRAVAPEGSAHGQGYAAAGVGMRADLAGDDVSVLRGTRLAKPGPSTDGQGYGGIGMGLSLDRGAGDDTYEMRNRGCWACLSNLHGFAYGRVGGSAIHFDDGGADVMSMDSRTSPSGPEDPAPEVVGGSRYLAAYAIGFGYGDDGGAGVAVSGEGPTHREAIAEHGGSNHAGAVGAQGFGYGDSSAGYGALHDEGGDDVYLARSTTYAVHDVRVGDGCDCSGAGAFALTHDAQSRAMAQADFGSIAVLRDGGGDDSYSLIAESIAEATAGDRRPQHVSGELAASATAIVENGARSIGQGAGNGGLALLHDHGGDDVYETTAINRSDADAWADAEGALTESRAVSGAADTIGQAAGVSANGAGELRDLDGSDRYATANESSAQATPPTDVVQGESASLVQVATFGSIGNAILLDLGEGTDVFASSPAATAPCLGERGDAMWRGCANGVALGANP